VKQTSLAAEEGTGFACEMLLTDSLISRERLQSVCDLPIEVLSAIPHDLKITRVQQKAATPPCEVSFASTY